MDGFIDIEQMATDLNLEVQSVTVFEENNALVIRVDLPGLSLERITITKNRGEIIIDALLPDPKYMIRQFHRRFDLPRGLNSQNAIAYYMDDVLEVRIPMGWYQSISNLLLPIMDPFRRR